jgi:CheY-like chemotaxis protein
MSMLTDKRVFIIEDNIDNRTIVQMLLEQQGALTAFERWGGADSIRRLREFMPVDLILLDLMLPNQITGYDVFDRIRREPDLAHIPIVAVSATDPTTGILRTQAKGFSGFIAKPVDYDLFPRQLVKIMNHEPVWNTK